MRARPDEDSACPSGSASTKEAGEEGAEPAPGTARRREAEVTLQSVEVELHRVCEPPLSACAGTSFSKRAA